jgi:hypothetical protein
MDTRQLAALAPDLSGSLRALRHAAAAARQLSLGTGTPFQLFKDGRVVDLNAVRFRSRRGRKSVRARRHHTR